MSNNDDWFGGIGDASDNGNGNYFRRGIYVAEVLRITRKISEDPDKRNARMVIAEFRVREVVRGFEASEAGLGSHEPGETVGSVFMIDDPSIGKLHLGKLKSLIAACLGDISDVDTDAKWKALAGKVTTPPGEMLAGSLIWVDCSNPHVTKKNRKTIYPAVYASLPESYAEKYDGDDDGDGGDGAEEEQAAE